MTACSNDPATAHGEDRTVDLIADVATTAPTASALTLLSTALLLGVRHGIDWDHIAAITDITSTTATADAGDERHVAEHRAGAESHHHGGAAELTAHATAGAAMALPTAGTFVADADPLRVRAASRDAARHAVRPRPRIGRRRVRPPGPDVRRAAAGLAGPDHGPGGRRHAHRARPVGLLLRLRLLPARHRVPAPQPLDARVQLDAVLVALVRRQAPRTRPRRAGRDERVRPADRVRGRDDPRRRRRDRHAGPDHRRGRRRGQRRASGSR